MKIFFGLAAAFALCCAYSFPEVDFWSVFVTVILICFGLWAVVRVVLDYLTARAATRPKAVADRAARLAEEFVSGAVQIDSARVKSAVREMVKLRDDLAPLAVHIPVVSVLDDHPVAVRAVCEANENTLRRVAELLHRLETWRRCEPSSPGSPRRDPAATWYPVDGGRNGDRFGESGKV